MTELNLDLWHRIAKGAIETVLYAFNWREMSGTKVKIERLEPFFVQDVKNHKIELRLSQAISTTVTTDSNGRFNEKISVDSLEGLNIKREILRYLAFDDDLQEQGDQGFVYLMRNQHGCSIISDIDDTIKISDVPDKRKLTVNTFNKDFQAVPGNLPFFHSIFYRIFRNVGTLSYLAIISSMYGTLCQCNAITIVLCHTEIFE